MLGKEQNTIEKTFLAMYEKEADALFRFVSFRTREREVAVDTVSEAYLRTWRYLSEGKQIDNLRAFLYRTARNIIIDEMRKGAIRHGESLDLMIEEHGEPEDTTPLPAYDPMDIERAKNLLQELEPPEYKEVLLLRYVEEWTPKEIGDLLSVSENVVSVRINRAIKKLRQQFQYEPI